MVVVKHGGWEMLICSKVAADPVELAKIVATLKMISEIEVVDAVYSNKSKGDGELWNENLSAMTG